MRLFFYAPLYKRLSVKRPNFLKSAGFKQPLRVVKRAIHGRRVVRIGGDRHAGVSPSELLQYPSGGVWRRPPAAADGPGVDLKDLARRNKRVHRVQRGGSIARAGFVKAAHLLVELGQQVEVTDHLRAGRVGNAPELVKVTFRRRVAVAVKSLRQKAARRLRAVVHGGIGRRIAADGQKVRRADGIVKRFEPFCVAEHVPCHASIHGNPPGIRRLEPPHFSQRA